MSRVDLVCPAGSPCRHVLTRQILKPPPCTFCLMEHCDPRTNECWLWQKSHPARRVNLSGRLYEKNVDSSVNSSRAYPDCLTLIKLTRLSEPKKREEKRKVDPDRRVTLHAQPGHPSGRANFCFSCKQFIAFRKCNVSKVGSPSRARLGNLFKYISFCFILLFTSSSPCRKDQFAVSYFSTSLIVLIQLVYNWEIRHHSLVCCCGLADILYILELGYRLVTVPPGTTFLP